MCAGNYASACNQESSSCGWLNSYCESTGGFFNTDAQSCGRPFLIDACQSNANGDGLCDTIGNQAVASMDCK